MVVFWFVLALVLLVAALVLLRLDAKQRGGGGSRAQEHAEDSVDAQPAPLAGAGGESDDDRDDDRDDELAGSAAAGPAGADAEVDDATEPEPAPDDPADVDISHTAPTGPAQAGPAQAGPAPADQADPEAVPLEARPLDPTEPAAESSPRLIDKVRGLMPARRRQRPVEVAEPPVEDPLAGSPVVRWLEDREFEPTPTPAPEFVHGDFAGGLSALGTVSHGVFRGRRAIMGVTGGRTVLALRRDTASDVVLDLSRPDIDTEPGFHDAGAVAALEARTSDYGRLDLIDRERLVEAVSEVPADVRRIWAEGEWVAATVDGTDDPSTWDDVVTALHATAGVLAPLPPVGGRARALPAEIDPGAPGSATGPEADPTMGMDGEVGTGTHGVAPTSGDGRPGGGEPAAGRAAVAAAGPDVGAGDNVGDVDAVDADTDTDTDDDDAAASAPTAPAVPTPRPGGHLRLVPDRTGARDLTDAPVVADRGDVEQEEPGGAETAGADAAGSSSDGPGEETSTGDEVTTDEPAAPEPDPFSEVMEPTGPPASRGDVAADFLPPRPPLSRPTRGAGQTYPEDASVPPLAAGAATGEAGIKPLGSEDDREEIRSEVARFDAARIDGGSDLEERPTGRHGAVPDEDPSEQTVRLSVAELAARIGAPPTTGRRRRRRAEDSDEETTDTTDESTEQTDADDPDADGRGEDSGRERPGVEPDVERTAKLQLPPDIRD